MSLNDLNLWSPYERRELSPTLVNGIVLSLLWIHDNWSDLSDHWGTAGKYVIKIGATENSMTFLKGAYDHGIQQPLMVWFA
jgi:hypothetical protein